MTGATIWALPPRRCRRRSGFRIVRARRRLDHRSALWSHCHAGRRARLTSCLGSGSPCRDVLHSGMTVLRNRHGDLNWPLFWHLLPAVAFGTAVGASAGGFFSGPNPPGVFRGVRCLHAHSRVTPPLSKAEEPGARTDRTPSPHAFRVSRRIYPESYGRIARAPARPSSRCRIYKPRAEGTNCIRYRGCTVGSDRDRRCRLRARRSGRHRTAAGALILSAGSSGE